MFSTPVFPAVVLFFKTKEVYVVAGLIDVNEVVLETERLILRAWEEEDLADLFLYASVQGVGEMAGWPHHRTMEDSRAILQDFKEKKEVFALYHREDGKVIGSLGLHKSWTDDRPLYSGLKIREMGYVLAKDYWGQGLMPEAARAVVTYCFEEVGLDALTSGHFVENNQSKRVIEKLGFKYVETVVLNSFALDKFFETKRYILLPEV